MQPQLDDLRFTYQPIVPLAGGLGAWSEALVRWHLPDGTVRGPNDILPHWLAPARIESFTYFTLLRGAQAVAASPGARVSVNLNPAQVQHPVTPSALEGMLGSVTERLYIEVVEEVLRDSAALARQLWLLSERCGGILLDDVTPVDLGNRTHIEAPVAGVKLDRTVVHNALYEANDGLRLGARDFVRRASERFEIVVAEGVEDTSACEELMALGVSHVQGFGIAKPEAVLRTSVSIAAPSRYAERPAGTGVPVGADRRTRPSS